MGCSDTRAKNKKVPYTRQLWTPRRQSVRKLATECKKGIQQSIPSRRSLLQDEAAKFQKFTTFGITGVVEVALYCFAYRGKAFERSLGQRKKKEEKKG